MSEQWLGPGEMARRLGVTPKALRVYEREGLVAAGRTEAGWRVYGPAQAARLHQIMALRGLGLPLKRIKTLLVEDGASLADVLSLQRDSLTAQRSKLTAAITLLGLALQKLDDGRDLSLDDLTHLTQETVMQQPAPMVALEAKILAQLNERAPGYDVTPLRDKLVAAIHNTGRTKKDVLAQVTALLTEGTEVMRSHADESEAAKQFVRRYYAVITGLREGVLSEGQAVPADLKSAMTGAMADAMSDPAIAEQSPFDLGVFDFIRRVSKAMKARGDLA
jgi:DNA-binding transcriptional MerR regulator